MPRLPTLLLAASLIIMTATPLVTSQPERVGPAPMDPFFIDPATRLPRLLARGEMGPDSIVTDAKGLAFAAPAWVAGQTETILRAKGHIEQFNVGLRVALDSDQIPNPVVAGYYFRPGAEGYNGVLVKFNGQGEMAYQAGVDTSQFDVLYGVGVDGAGNAFGGGYTFHSGSYKMLIAKVDSAGTKQWTKVVAADAGSIYNLGFDAAVDSMGNVVVAGLSLGTNFNYDAAVVKLDPMGNTIFAKRINLPASQEYILSAAVDGADNILLGGIEFGVGGYKPLVMKLDKNGNVLARTTVPGFQNTVTYGIAVDKDGNVLLGGYTFTTQVMAFVARLHPDLTVDWAQGITAGIYTIGTDIAVDDAGNAIIGGYGFSGQDLGFYDIFLAKVAPSGVTTFTRLIDDLDDPQYQIGFGVAVSPDGLFIGTGGYTFTGGGYDILSTKSLGVSVAGAAGGALNTATNVRALL